jgi:hypothetical protein
MAKPGNNSHIPAQMTGGRSYSSLRERFVELVTNSAACRITDYATPDIYDQSRVNYVIPPVTDIDKRTDWHPGNIYIVLGGSVAIGRVFYTRTSGEYLIEELVLKRGDLFGEFEVPLSIITDPDKNEYKFPPRFNMTYGAWATGPALNWAMAYPRHIPRDPISLETARVAVHPFYIKSKNIRPVTEARIAVIASDVFENIISENPEAMTWFLMNVLRKTRLYFEPPSEGYGNSPDDIISRLFIRVMAYRIRLGFVVFSPSGNIRSCRSFIGPTEWLKYGLAGYMTNLKGILHSIGEKPREKVKIPVFADELDDIFELVSGFPVKELDREMLEAMGCSPDADRKDSRYGLLTGIRMEVKDLDKFNNYLLEKGE